MDELLADPGLLVHADPATVIPALHIADSEQAQLAAAVYRVSAGGHPGRSPDQRCDVLAVDAARYGASTLLHRLVSSPGTSRSRWRPRWATGGQVSAALRTTLAVHTSRRTAIACSQFEGRPVAAVIFGWDKVGVLDLTTGTSIGDPLTGHTGPVAAVACTPIEPLSGCSSTMEAVACTMLDGRPVAVTGGSDRTVRVWDLETRRQVGRIELPGGVRAIAVTAAGEIVAAFGWDIVVLERTSDVKP